MTINTYYGVRVSESEASLLQLRLDAREVNYPIPEPIKSRAEWLHDTCLRMSRNIRHGHA